MIDAADGVILRMELVSPPGAVFLTGDAAQAAKTLRNMSGQAEPPHIGERTAARHLRRSHLDTSGEILSADALAISLSPERDDESWVNGGQMKVSVLPVAGGKPLMRKTVAISPTD